MIQQGDIVLISYPFTNLSSTKVRPALVVSSSEFNSFNKEAVCVFITSRYYDTPFDLQVNQNSDGFERTGLRQRSTVRVGKIATLHLDLVKRHLGSTPPVLMKEVKKILNFLLHLS